VQIYYSNFQDRCSTIHYLIIVGDNGTGKSAFGDTFEALGYRAVNMTDPTPANWYRVLGSIEFGQVTIIADEADKIDLSQQIMSILKTGYHIKGKVPRMDKDNKIQEFFNTYCFKIIVCEKSPNPLNAKGFLDRSFIIKSFIGFPQYDIKEIRNPQGNAIRKQLFDEINDLRKLLLIFRLVNFKEPLPEIDIGIDGRDKELCKPLLQLFYNTEVQNEIEETLQFFVNIKNKRKENTIEALIYPVIINAISQYGSEISSTKIWNLITYSIEGTIDEKNPNIFHSSDYGSLYRNIIIKMISDKFGVEIKHKENGNILIFNLENVKRIGRIYYNKNGIQTKLVTGNINQNSISNNFSDWIIMK